MSRTCPMITDPERVRELLCEAPVPSVPQVESPVGLAWLRAHVPRFTDGADHVRRRALVVAELDRISPAVLREQVRAIADRPLAHVEVLMEALGVQGVSASVVETVARHYQPHEPDSVEADAGVVQLVAALGGVGDEVTAARICVLAQACAATSALVANPGEVAVRSTRRVVEGEVVELDMRHSGFGWGMGVHACPGREHAVALVLGILGCGHSNTAHQYPIALGDGKE